MKLNFRDLKQQKFAIEAEPSDTIAQVKEKVAAERGWEVSQQKLIYSGKILVDTHTVESYNIEEKGFIVCMIAKPKPAATKPVEPSTPAASSATPAPPAAPQHTTTSAAASNPPATPSPAGVGETVPSAETPAAPASFNDPSALLVGDQGRGVVANMEAMGFSRADIDRAMRAAYFNPDRAVEYLLNGIPESVQAEQRNTGAARANPEAAGGAGAQATGAAAQATGAATQATSPTAEGETGSAAATDEGVNLFEAAAQAGGRAPGAGAAGAGTGAAAGQGAGQSDLEFLRNNPQFHQLRQLVQQQPAMLEPVLRQVAEGNPRLAHIIGQNQEQFLQLLSEDTAGPEGIGGMGDTGPLPPGSTPISVTVEERDAIERLCRLGFPRDQVVQAYFACDKNEEMAANFLFDEPPEED